MTSRGAQYYAGLQPLWGHKHNGHFTSGTQHSKAFLPILWFLHSSCHRLQWPLNLEDAIEMSHFVNCHLFSALWWALSHPSDHCHLQKRSFSNQRWGQHWSTVITINISRVIWWARHVHLANNSSSLQGLWPPSHRLSTRFPGPARIFSCGADLTSNQTAVGLLKKYLEYCM